MKRKVNSIEMTFGDARFRLYHIQLPQEDLGPKAPIYHDHGYYELHFAVRGSYEYKFPGKEVTLAQHQMLIIPPGVPHNTILTENGDYEHTALQLVLTEGKGIGGFHTYFKETLNTMALTPLSFAPALLQPLHQLKRSDLYDADAELDVRGYCYLSAQAYTLLYGIFDGINEFGSAKKHTAVHRDRMDSLVLLDSLINNPRITLSEIAEKINYSERHTARLIEQVYHMSFSELRQKRKKEDPLSVTDYVDR